MSETKRPVAVDPWRLSLLLETARKWGGGTYIGWFVKRWVANVTRNGPLPGSFEDWKEDTKEDA